MLPIVAALIAPDMHLDEVITDIGVEQAALSLLDALAAVPDPRSARGVRHGVLVVLLVSACAVLTGAPRSSRSPSTPTTPGRR